MLAAGTTVSKTINCIVAAATTEIGIGWSLEKNPAEAVKEAIAMALQGKRNKTPNIAIMFVNTNNDISAINSEAGKIFNDKTKLYGGISDPDSLINNINNKGFIYTKHQAPKKSLTQEKTGVVIITVSSREVSFGIGSSDLSKSQSVRLAAKSATLKAMTNAQKYNEKRPKLVFLMTTPSSENEAIEGAKEVLDRSYIILCGSAEKDRFSIFAEKDVYKSGVSVAVVYTNLPIGLNVINRSYKKIKMPPTIKSLLALRLNVKEV